MANNSMVITDAGLAEIVNAEQNGTAPVVLTQVALGTGQYTATADRTAMDAEFKRLSTIAGGAIGDNRMHVTMVDDSSDAYTVYEVGVFTDSGVLFAVCSNKVPILQKAAVSEAYLSIDFELNNINPDSVTVGDTNFQLNGATTEKRGIVELATSYETQEGLDETRAVTPKGLAARTATESRTGVIELATSAEVIAGTDTARAVTPAGLRAALPAGVMMPFAGKTVPSGWLLCNGAAVSRTTYANLFAAIGTAWGTGDGSTTFNLPDLNERFIEGTTDASKVGTYLEAGLPNITGFISGNGNNGSDIFSSVHIGGAFADSGKITHWETLTMSDNNRTGFTCQVDLDSSKSNGIYGKSNTVQPKTCQTLMIIKI